MNEERRLKAVVIGISTGGVETLKRFLSSLPPDFPLPLLITQHIGAETGSAVAELLDKLCAIRVKEADEQEVPVGGTVYLAPADYHLMVEPDGRLGLSTDPPVNFARPSVDVLFETAADAFGAALVGIVMTGVGADGSRGLRRIKERGGVAVVQDPDDAAASPMPRNASLAVPPDHVVTLDRLVPLLMELAGRS